MKYIQFLLLTFYNLNAFSADFSDDSVWSNLLHIEGSVREIASPDWFLTTERTAKSESLAIIDAMKDANKLNSIFCEFPARFLYLHSVLNLNFVYNYDKCEDLSNFVKSFDKKNISIAITSEYYNAPSSAFGHIMLLFHNMIKPELDSSVVHFSALSKNEDFVSYSMNGLTGNYAGFFFKEPLFKKYNEYSNVEQRYIFVHPLILSDYQRKLLIFHLYELQKARFKYYFLTENCGYQINKLLQIVFQVKGKVPTLYFLPSEVLLNNLAFIKPAIVLPPLSVRAKSSIDSLSLDEHIYFNKIISDDIDKPKVDKSLSEKLKKSLVLYSQYQFRKNNNVLSSYKDIQLLSVSGLDSVDTTIKPVYSPALKPSPRRFSIGFFKAGSNGSSSAVMSFRPLLVDLNDFQNHSLHESNFNILNTEVKYEQSKILLQRLDIIDLKLITNYDRYFTNPSWFLNAGINRENSLNDYSISNSFGVGQTFNLFFSFTYFLGAGIDLIKLKALRPSFVSSFNSFCYLSDNQKILYDGMIKVSKERTFYTHDLSYKKKFSKVNASLGVLYSKDFKQYFKLDYYF
jgi:hypothetical protein